MQSVGLVPIRGWPHRVTRASNRFAGGDALSVVKPSSVLYRGVGEKCSLWASSSAGSAPSCSPARAYCIVKLPSVLYRGGGEKCLQLQARPRRDRGVGRGVTFRLECEDVTLGRGSARREVGPPFPCTHSCFGNSVCYPGSPFRGGEMHVAWGLLCCCLSQLHLWWLCVGGVCSVPMTSGVLPAPAGVWLP